MPSRMIAKGTIVIPESETVVRESAQLCDEPMQTVKLAMKIFMIFIAKRSITEPTMRRMTRLAELVAEQESAEQ